MAVRGARRVSQAGPPDAPGAARNGGRRRRLAARSPSAVERVARATIHRILGRIRGGRLVVVEAWSGERLEFGAGETLVARVEVRSRRLYVELARGRSVAFGRSYALGHWETDDLVSVCRLASREIRRSDRLRRRLAPLAAPFFHLGSLPFLNTRSGARDNVAAHYDLGNELFELFLDRDTLMYSSAVFEHPEQSLEDAQRSRLDRVCTKLELDANDHLLEIGTGWGGMAVHAASRYGCRVTTTTISREQRTHAQARVRAAGLEDRVTVLGADYRDLRGRFDKLVSIEMIEAVGWQYLDRYFRRCSELLRPNGLLFLQAIAIEDGAYEAEKRGRSFANQLIFPGGCLPSLQEMQRCLAHVTDMRTIWLEDISASYVLTLQHWRERFDAATRELEALGYEERFRRLWSLWLAMSQAGFQEARIMDLQLLAAKPGWSGRPARE